MGTIKKHIGGGKTEMTIKEIKEYIEKHNLKDGCEVITFGKFSKGSMFITGIEHTKRTMPDGEVLIDLVLIQDA